METFESRRACKRVNECHSHHINYLLQSSQQSHEQEGYYSSHLTDRSRQGSEKLSNLLVLTQIVSVCTKFEAGSAIPKPPFYPVCLVLTFKEGEILKHFIKISEKLLTPGETHVESNE